MLVAAAAAIVGVAVGRFVLPEIEGVERVGIQISQDKHQGCSMFVAVEKTVLGRLVSTTEGSESAACGKFAEVAPDVRVVCDCDGLTK